MPVYYELDPLSPGLCYLETLTPCLWQLHTARTQAHRLMALDKLMWP